MVSSNGVAAGVAEVLSDWAAEWDTTAPAAAKRQPSLKTDACRKITRPIVMATLLSTSGNTSRPPLVPLEKAVDVFGQLGSDSFRGRDLLHRCLSEPVHGTELAQKQVLSVLAYAGAIVENAFADALFH